MTAAVQASLDSVARPSGLLRGLDRWVVPQSFLSWTERTGERYLIRAPLAPPVLLTCSAEDCRAIFTERDGVLLFGEGLRRLAPHEAMFGHDAIASLDGEEHTRLRRQLTAAFHGEALKGYERGILEVAERHVASWPAGEPVRFAELTKALARDVIVRSVFGITDPVRAARLQRALDELEAAVNSLELAGRFAAAILLRGRWAPYPRMARVHAEIEAVTREEIEARRLERRLAGDRPAAGSRPDCMARFLELDEDALADEEIVAALRVLVVAGWATTANTLAWAAERLARHPDALAACLADARGGAGATQGRYLMATVQETLRMRPPVPVTVRYVTSDFDLNGLRVPKGTLLAADIERMHFRPDLYPEPRRFRPERFLDTRPGTYTWIPFGGGVHRCIGAGFALTEARLVLQSVLRRFTFAPQDGGGEPSQRRTLITAPGRRATVTLVAA